MSSRGYKILKETQNPDEMSTRTGFMEEVRKEIDYLFEFLDKEE